MTWGGSSHPLDWASSSPFSHRPAALPAIRAYVRDRNIGLPVFPFDTRRKPIRLGNDVWIGTGAMILDGVSIGDGAVVAARSVVTRDVAPYVVVGGAPAREIRTRFAAPVIDRFCELQPWRFGPEELQANDPREPARFLDRLQARIACGAATPLVLPTVTGPEIIRAVAGTARQEPTA